MTKIEAARQEYADWCSAIGIDSIPTVAVVQDRNDTGSTGSPSAYLLEAERNIKHHEK